MFGCAMEWEWAEGNPVPAFLKSRKRRGLRESPPRSRYLTHDEETRLLAAARDEHATPGLHDAICVAIDTGMRREEQLGLRRARVSQARNQIELAEDSTKNSQAREIPLLPRAAKILAQLPAHLRSDYVFVNPETGTRFAGLNKGLAGAARRAKIRPLTWHDLRRTCGCRLLQDHGMSLEQVRLWLGHSSVTVTEKTYAFLETVHLHRAIGAGTKAGTGTAD
jgi:integrase